MSAVKIIFKRSSLLGKRPSGANLEPGEIGLNTNSNDPGLFFEVNDGSVVKAGPTAYLPEAPTQTPARGELWVDSDTKAMSVGNGLGDWQKVAAPFLGGTNGLTVFVAPEYENATDSLSNDGQTVPFITINRAIIEVTKRIIQDSLNKTNLGNNRYLIILAPGQHCVVNTPGVTPSNFTVDFDNPYKQVTQADLSQFNPESLGGLILPRGVSIIGLDLKKCEVHPTYVPKYTHPAFPAGYQQQSLGPVYENQPPSSIFRWSGNTYVSNFSGLDKIEYRLVEKVTTQSGTNYALFKSNRPHGLGYNDFVQVTYSDTADQVGASFTSGAYYANPVTSYEFLLSPTSWTGSDPAPVLAAAMPQTYFSTDAASDPKFDVFDIYPYFIPLDGESYETSPYSHHRLSLLRNASLEQLNNFYIKVQKAFSSFFGGEVNTSLVSAPEYEIVAPTLGSFPNNLPANSTNNSSPYQNMVNHRSDYGMSNGDYDGSIVGGFKSVIINSATAVILQRDPAPYEIYSTGEQTWIHLTQFTQKALGSTRPITSIPTKNQLQNLNEAAIPNIRYYYTTLKVTDPVTQIQKSTGLADPDNDFRHFGFRISGANSYMQAQSTYTIGAAISCWARDGAIMSLTNATSNFGSVAFQAEGFAGIGTLGGANEVNKGFLQAGINLPLSLTETQVNSDTQKKILSLGSKVVYVGPDPTSPSVQLVYLQGPFSPETILPFSLRPDSAVYVEDGSCTFRGFFVTNGEPTCILSESDPLKNPYATGGAILRLRLSDSNIPNGPTSQTCLQVPYIRRFIDPRTDSQRAYGFYIQSTNPNSSAPLYGYTLRLNQTGQNLSNTIKRNYQFDPGQFGGISQVFTVDYVDSAPFNASVNFNNKIADNSQATAYTVYASLTDASSPWVQSVKNAEDWVPFNHPMGAYITYNSRNYYAAENDLWGQLYYNTTFNPLNGPTKVSPNKGDSAYVITSVLEKQENVTEAWQGYVPDPYYEFYTTEIPSPYREELTYMRGAVVPYQEYSGDLWVDIDDSSRSMGIIFTKEVSPVDPVATVTTSPSVISQTEVKMTSPFVANPSFGRPATMTLQLLQVSPLVHPKNGLSVVQITSPGINAREYARVIGITSNSITVIRNYYPQYAVGTLPDVWPVGSIVAACFEGCYPEPSVYDPDWAVTKATILRYYELMGYTREALSPYLKPRYAGERVLLNSNLPLSPVNGYANVTTAWPVEFNSPSTIYANTHTWQYVGYMDYSRGLPKYQVNQLPRKLQFDFLGSSAWGGKLSMLGSDNFGSMVFLGDFREGLTGNFFNFSNPEQNYYDNVVRETPLPIEEYPNSILTYSADDISDLFNGSQTSFDLKRGGLSIPPSQLSTFGLFVTLGGVMQIPGQAYTLGAGPGGQVLPVILFTDAPQAGTSCDIRIVTSDDNEKTLEVVSYAPSTTFDGVQSTFVISPADTGINNDNSFIFLSGVAQTPLGSGHPRPAYTVTNIPGQTDLSFIGGAPLAGTSFDFRAIVSGPRFRQSNYPIVNVISVDDISVFFDGGTTSFPLYVDNIPLNPSLVNAENMFVTLGAVTQIPHQVAGDPPSGNAYTVQVNQVTNILEITFATAPLPETSCTIRVISSEPKDFIICPLPVELQDQPLVAGDGVTANSQNEIIRIDPGLIG